MKTKATLGTGIVPTVREHPSFLQPGDPLKPTETSAPRPSPLRDDIFPKSLPKPRTPPSSTLRGSCTLHRHPYTRLPRQTGGCWRARRFDPPSGPASSLINTRSMAARTCIREHGHMSVNRARTGQEHDPCRESASSWILELHSLLPSRGLSLCQPEHTRLSHFGSGRRSG